MLLAHPGVDGVLPGPGRLAAAAALPLVLFIGYHLANPQPQARQVFWDWRFLILAGAPDTAATVQHVLWMSSDAALPLAILARSTCRCRLARPSGTGAHSQRWHIRNLCKCGVVCSSASLKSTYPLETALACHGGGAPFGWYSRRSFCAARLPQGICTASLWHADVRVCLCAVHRNCPFVQLSQPRRAESGWVFLVTKVKLTIRITLCCPTLEPCRA